MADLWRLNDGVDNAVSEDGSCTGFWFDTEQNSSETKQRKQDKCSTSRSSAQTSNDPWRLA